ncbi:MAG TPA: TonB-dependent receptor [Chitinophagaceae bacterium]
MKRNEKPAILLFALMLIALLPCYSQDHGNLSGKVIDQNGNILPGASVIVDGSTLGTSTDLNGFYTLRGIPAGQKKITVEYLGYSPLSVTVTIEKGKTATNDFKMTEVVKSLGVVTVSSAVDGQQRALNQQKTADNIMQIISADQIGRFPDLNVAEALQRVSGVTITRNRGEGAEIQLRGTPANFVNININGEQIMGVSEGGKRNPSLDVIPSDVLASMEVQKTLLPSNDGDAIAGVINMRTAIARSLKSKITIDASTGYNVLREKAPYNLKVGYAKRFAANGKNKDGRFGIAANVSYYNTYNGYDRLEAQTWLPKDIVNSAGTAIPELKGTYVPTDFRYRYQEGRLTRMGGTLSLDYAPSVKTRFVLSGMYNKREEDDNRYRNRYRYRGAFYDRGDGKIGTDRIQNVVQATYQNIWTDNFNINLDGETTLGSWKIDGGVFYSKIQKDAINGQYGFQTPDWRSNNANIVGTDNGTGVPIKIPTRTVLAEMPSYKEKFLKSYYVYTPPFGGSADDPSRFNFYTVDNNDHSTTGTNMTARVNVKKDYFLNKKYASTFSFGFKGKFMNNDRHRPQSATVSSIATITSTTSPDYGDTRLARFLYKPNLSSEFMNGHLSFFGAAAEVKKIQDFIKNRPDRFVLDAYRTSINADAFYYDASEHIASGYLMNKIQFKKVMMIAGLRLENTTVDYKANKIFSYDKDANPNVNGGQKPGATTPIYNAYVKTLLDTSLNYLMVLPNLQFKFDLAKNLVLRTAWTSGYSRPNVQNLMPTLNVNTDLGKIEKGNPGLKAARANNLDFLVEHYMKNVGLISGGFFYKHINRFQYLSEGPITDPTNPYFNSGATDQLIMTEPRNGKSANVSGVELTLNSSLSFLPGFLKNLVFTSNYSLIHSNAVTDQKRGKLRLPGQAKNTGNVALAYSSSKLTLQVSANYNGDFIYALGTDKETDLWMDSRWQFDVNGSFKITKRLLFYAEVVNLTNSSAFTYMGNKTRVYELEYTDAFVRTGLSFRL